MKFMPALFLCLAFPCGLRAEEDGRRILAEVNFARTQPRAYAGIVARTANRSRAASEAIRFLERAEPRPPLKHSSALALAAQSHVESQGPRGAMGHSSRDGTGCFQRIARHGQWSGLVGENIAYGGGGARDVVVRLIVDEGVFSRGHRANIFSRAFRVAGIAAGPHARYGAMCVMDFADGFVAKRRRTGFR